MTAILLIRYMNCAIYYENKYLHGRKNEKKWKQ